MTPISNIGKRKSIGLPGGLDAACASSAVKCELNKEVVGIEKIMVMKVKVMRVRIVL